MLDPAAPGVERFAKLQPFQVGESQRAGHLCTQVVVADFPTDLQRLVRQLEGALGSAGSPVGARQNVEPESPKRVLPLVELCERGSQRVDRRQLAARHAPEGDLRAQSLHQGARADRRIVSDLTRLGGCIVVFDAGPRVHVAVERQPGQEVEYAQLPLRRIRQCRARGKAPFVETSRRTPIGRRHRAVCRRARQLGDALLIGSRAGSHQMVGNGCDRSRATGRQMIRNLQVETFAPKV